MEPVSQFRLETTLHKVQNFSFFNVEENQTFLMT